MATTQELIAAQLMKTGGDRNVDPLSRGLASFLGARKCVKKRIGNKS